MLAFTTAAAVAAIFALVASFTVSGHSQFDLPESNGQKVLYLPETYEQAFGAYAEGCHDLAEINEQTLEEWNPEDSGAHNALDPNAHLLKSKKKDDHDQVIKVILVGSAGVGKSNLKLRFLKNEFDPESIPSSGLEISEKTVKINGKLVKFELWDGYKDGKERYKPSYYHGAKGILLVYDNTDRFTFISVKRWWLEYIEKYAPSPCDVAVTLVSNSFASEDPVVVSAKEGKAFADEHGLNFIEASAFTGKNVNEAFYGIFLDAYRVANKH